MNSLAVDAGRDQREVADALLAVLRAELDGAGVGYSVPPVSLSGGFETLKYRFELSGAPPEWSGPLVLRVFSTASRPERAVLESAVQNSLAGQGYPVPHVLETSVDARILGGPFMIMQYMPGQTLLEANLEGSPAVLGAAHAELHQLAPQPLIEMLREKGADDRWFRYSARLERLSGKRVAHPWLAEVLQWLVDNRPSEPAQLSICHGDFHPLNILMQDGRISAVLDWSGFTIADSAMDVAFTIVILSVAGPEVFPTESVASMVASYQDAYKRMRSLDSENVAYYRTLRCVMALIEGAEGQDIWAGPAVVARLTEWIEEQSGISVFKPH